MMGWISCVLMVLAVGASSVSAQPKKDKDKDKKKDPKEQVAPVPAPAPTPTPAPEDETPWGKGVSAENKATAKRLLGEGNDQFVVNKFREALAKYEEAVAAWEHPSIRFNMVRTLIALDRPLEASKSLEKALVHGKGPLEDSMYTEALNYQKLLAGQIAEYELTCKQQGVTVKVDGENLLDCPGTKAKQTLPGNHVVVGAKAGFLTHTQDIVLLPGKKQPIVIELITIQNATIYKPRWKTWKPWAVVGGGAVLAGLGVLLNFQASSEMADLQGRVSRDCERGCTEMKYEEDGLAKAESRAIAENRVAIGMMVAGSAVVVGGLVGVILNRPQAHIQEKREKSAPTAQVVPTVSTDGGGFAVFGRF